MYRANLLYLVILACHWTGVTAVAETDQSRAEEEQAFHQFTEKIMNSNPNDAAAVKKSYDETLAPVQRRREEDAAKTGKIDPKPIGGSPSKYSPGSANAPATPSDQPTEQFVFSPPPKSAIEAPTKKVDSGQKPKTPETPSSTGLGALQSRDVQTGWSFSKPKATPIPSASQSAPPAAQTR